jgi:hypothetical protein
MYQYQILKNYFNIFLNKKYIKKKKHNTNPNLHRKPLREEKKFERASWVDQGPT